LVVVAEGTKRHQEFLDKLAPCHRLHRFPREKLMFTASVVNPDFFKPSLDELKDALYRVRAEPSSTQAINIVLKNRFMILQHLLM
jgi:hypothetical protein